MSRSVDYLFFCLLLAMALLTSSQKISSHRFQANENDAKDFFKKLEYAANHKGANNQIPDGLSTIDLNLIGEEEFAWEIADGVDEGLDPYDHLEIDQGTNMNNAGKGQSSSKQENDSGPLLMHQGSYAPSPEWNSYLDLSLIPKVKKDIIRRQLDPIYFTIHKRGIVRHAPKGHKTRGGELISEEGIAAMGLQGSQNRTGILGAGHIEGLKKLRRVGNAESRETEDKLLVRSHYFFGRLNVELVFRVTNGLREINSTLTSLAAHALHQIDPATNATNLLEFIIDSPLEYEIELRGSRNKRLLSLSQSALLRLLKRKGRMNRRLHRAFERATRKSSKNTEEVSTSERKPPISEPPSL